MRDCFYRTGSAQHLFPAELRFMHSRIATGFSEETFRHLQEAVAEYVQNNAEEKFVPAMLERIHFSEARRKDRLGTTPNVVLALEF